jgi:hypothetical protein
MFKRESQYKYIEVEKGTRLPELTNDLKESLAVLSHHPAFQYILMRLRFEKGQVQAYLNEGYQLDDKALRYLQAGIYWLSYIETQVNSLTRQPSPSRIDVPVDLNEEFRTIASSLESIG